jgi:hypothetical protein
MEYIDKENIVKRKDESNSAYRIMSARITFLAEIKAKPALFIG